jgi:hypothetical protein
MTFGNYKSISEASLAHQISVKMEMFLQPVPLVVDARFRDDLTWALENFYVRASEASICEFIIAPLLREVWKPHSDVLQLWSHVAFGPGEELQRTPDYFFSRRSPLGMVNDQPPFVLVVEAKKDDFDAGWGQCLAAMFAAQQLNGMPPRTIYGSVSTGEFWQFGKLHDRDFTREFRSFVLSDLPGLFAAWNYVFIQAKEQALAPAA